MIDDPDYKVGYGRPPLETRFKKGQPPPPRRTTGNAGAIDLVAFFAERVPVPVGGRMTRMDVFEVTLTNLAQKAIKGDLRAAKRFINICAEAGMLKAEVISDGWPPVLYIPKDYDPDEWRANLARLGPPPWPGEHNGLPRLTVPWKPTRDL